MNIENKSRLSRNHEPLQPSERHNFNKATSDRPPPPAPSGPPVGGGGGAHSRRMKPMTPTKPSTLSFRQSSALNGSTPNYAVFGATQFQMPKEQHFFYKNMSLLLIILPRKVILTNSLFLFERKLYIALKILSSANWGKLF